MLAGSVGLAAGAATSLPFLVPRYDQVRRPSRSRVAILRAEEYSERLERDLLSGLRLFDLDLRGKSVLLKPNLVDFLPGVDINTHPLLVVAAAQCFLNLGAASVSVAEGPGHQRDTELVLSESGFRTLFDEQRIPFVDLNRDRACQNEAACKLHRLGAHLAAAHSAQHRFCGFHAQSEDPSLVWCHAKHEKLVRSGPRREIRLAQEHFALAGNRVQHRRHLRDRSGSFRHCRWHLGDGG